MPNQSVTSVLTFSNAVYRCLLSLLPTINPFASINDGYIHITSFKKLSLVDYIRELPKLKKGTPIVHPEVNYFKTKKVRIQSENSFGEMDGEGFTSSNITFEIQEKSLLLLML